MKIGRYLLVDLLKHKVVIGTFLLFLVAGWGVFLIEGQPEKALMILMQLSLLALPLLTLIFSSIYYYNAADFIVLILSQPIERKTVIRNIYFGLTTSFVLCYLLGIGLPLLVFNASFESFVLLLFGSLLIYIFVAISLFISIVVKDRVKGMGVTLILWAFFAVLFDGLLLYLMYQFGEYPIEKVILFLTFLNPTDIARIAVIMNTDTSALMGLSGAVFTNFFNSQIGLLISLFSMIIWSTVCYFATQKRFEKMDV